MKNINFAGKYRREVFTLESHSTGLNLNKSGRMKRLSMIENRSIMILNEPGEITNNYGDGLKTISFELNIIGQPTYFSICVAQKQARLSDITPLARGCFQLNWQLWFWTNCTATENLSPAVKDAQLAAIT